MKLEVGKCYVYRNGGISAPLEEFEVGDHDFLYDSNTGCIYGCNEAHGHLVFPPIYDDEEIFESPHDLMSEA